jgi:uncharacterized repeat protein (TIGR01451 family)
MFRSIMLAGVLFSASAAPAIAQEFYATQIVERAVITGEDADGTAIVEFQEAERVQPGDALLYKLSYTNGTPDAIENASLVMAVPAEVTYNENSASGDNTSVAFSTDGGQSFAPRGELTISSDGTRRPATSEDITHIRWSFSGQIVPGAVGEVTYGAVVR